MRHAGDAVKVGIVWAGTPLHQNDRSRSCRLADFRALAGVANVRWYSLQKGPGDAQLSEPPEGMNITPLGDDLNDFGDTAALLECLDLLISVDTSPVHLAGAMARPVWTLVARGPDWRWMLDREDSPWYPTLRLFRQGPFGRVGRRVRAGEGRAGAVRRGENIDGARDRGEGGRPVILDQLKHAAAYRNLGDTSPRGSITCSIPISRTFPTGATR
jgi:hypothetical protein